MTLAFSPGRVMKGYISADTALSNQCLHVFAPLRSLGRVEQHCWRVYDGMTMSQQSPRQSARLTRYHEQSVRLLRDAMNEARQSRWLRCEELLWGSVTLAVRGVALSRGDEVDDRQAVEQYAQSLGRERNDRRIRDAFTRLSTFADAADRMRDSRGGAQQLISILEDVTSAVEKLWDLVPLNEDPTPGEDWDSVQ